MSRFARSKRVAGFTLIEMVTALAALSLLATAMSVVVQFSLRGATVGQARASALEDSATTQRFLRRALASAYPFDVSADQINAPMVGSAESVEFTAGAPRALAVQGYYRYRVSVERAGPERMLVAHFWVDRNGNAVTDAAQQREVLLRGFERVRFEYWDAATDRPGRWLSEWRAKTGVPGLVKVSVTYPPGDRRSFPDLVVRPRIEADAQCAFDLVGRRCRELS